MEWSNKYNGDSRKRNKYIEKQEYKEQCGRIYGCRTE